MRSSRIPYAEVKEVVFLGDPRFLVHEWPKLRNLPKITVVDGDPLNRSDLRAISIKFCAMCVVLSTWTGYTADPALDDKAAVLATLNIRAMPFDRPSEGDSGDLRIPTITTLRKSGADGITQKYETTLYSRTYVLRSSNLQVCYKCREQSSGCRFLFSFTSGILSLFPYIAFFHEKIQRIFAGAL